MRQFPENHRAGLCIYFCIQIFMNSLSLWLIGWFLSEFVISFDNPYSLKILNHPQWWHIYWWNPKEELRKLLKGNWLFENDFSNFPSHEEMLINIIWCEEKIKFLSSWKSPMKHFFIMIWKWFFTTENWKIPMEELNAFEIVIAKWW